MPRVSREQMARNHERVLAQASRLVRERGADVSIPEVMAAAGLTPGGFYKHFASKDDLLAQAGAAAFDARVTALGALARDAPDRDGAFERFLADYLSVRHRDSPGQGCASVSLAADAASRAPDDPLHRAYVTGTRRMVGALEALRPEEETPDEEALAEFATMVGALVLARATAGDDISERILAAAHEHLTEGRRRRVDPG